MRLAMRAMLGVVLTTLCCGQVIAAESKSAWWPFGGNEEVAVPPIATAPPIETQTVPTSAPAPATESKSWLSSVPKPSMPDMPEMPKLKKPSMPEVSWPKFGSDEATAAATTTPPAIAATPSPTVPTTAAAAPITPVGPRRPAMRFGKASHHAPRRNRWAEPAPQAEQTAASPWQSVSKGAKRVGDSTAAAWHKTVDAVTPGDGTATPASATVSQQTPEKPWWNFWDVDVDAQPEGPRTVTEWMAQERLDP